MSTAQKYSAINSWVYYRDLYRSCINNLDYINTIDNHYTKIESTDRSFLSERINNNDIIIGSHFDTMVQLFMENKLITSRLGCVENRFLINYLFDRKIPGDFQPITQRYDDSLMKSNAGMYYAYDTDKALVNTWWIDNTKELLTNPNTTIVSCFLVLAYDLYCLSCLDVKNKIIDSYILQTQLIDYFKDRKILIISNGIEDMQRSYALGLQRIYKKTLPNFSVAFLESPQTTTSMPYPHRNMIETADMIIDTVEKKYKNYDTIMFCCGGYAAPIINIMSKLYNNKNLIYMGSELYTFFGLYSQGIHKPQTRTSIFNLNEFIPIEKQCPIVCKNIDNGKYWKI